MTTPNKNSGHKGWDSIPADSNMPCALVYLLGQADILHYSEKVAHTSSLANSDLLFLM